MHYKLYFQVALVLGVFFIPRFANAESGAVTDITCGGISSKIVSACRKKSFCESQQWIINDRVIDLKKLNSEDFVLVRWACLPSSSGERIVFYFVNWGNCDTCERLSIWTPTGEQISDWKNFSEDYRSSGFPKVQGEKFHEQFSQINRTGKN